ncbi:MAG: NUDIX domain-containing protein, partial [Acidimicrobiales bacterium]
TLVRQVRVAVGEALLELPAGTRDVEGEPPEATARRELEEEAGLRAGRMEPLIAVYNSPGFCDQRTTIFLATDLTPCATAPAGAEERWMSVAQVRLADVERLVADGRLVDETTVLGLLLARAAVG